MNVIDLFERGLIYTCIHVIIPVSSSIRNKKEKQKSKAQRWGSLRDLNNIDPMQNARKEAAHIRSVRVGPFV
jgi:hypothetical protein